MRHTRFVDDLPPFRHAQDQSVIESLASERRLHRLQDGGMKPAGGNLWRLRVLAASVLVISLIGISTVSAAAASPTKTVAPANAAAPLNATRPGAAPMRAAGGGRDCQVSARSRRWPGPRTQ